MNRVVYQGIDGAYSSIAARALFTGDAQLIGVATFCQQFEQLAARRATHAILPLENSLIGTIYEVFDLLAASEVEICAEHYVKVEHCLLGIDPAGSLSEIQKVYSHPKALEQCRRFFQDHPWIEACVYYDTAAAAKEVQELNCPHYAAIASCQAADLYGLSILQKSIQDDSNNYTRFGVATWKPYNSHLATKSSLLLHIENRAGALANVLKLFADKGMNLSKIESRPLRTRPFEYEFYLDVEFIERRALEEVVKELQAHVSKIKILGCYHGHASSHSASS